MGRTKEKMRSLPPLVKDHMVSQEYFQLEYREEYKAYKTVPAPTNIDYYYDHPKYLSHQEKASGLMAFAYQLIRTYNIKLKINWLKKASPEGSTILDYGCGTGDFLAAVKRTDWICEGLESNPKAQNIAAKKGLSVYLDHSAVSAKLYDVICLWHVFEHLENPRQIKQWLYNHLSSPGVLIIAVPNFNSWEAKYYGEHWAAYDVPRHLWHFSQESIKAIFEPDFEVLEQHSMWFDAFYISLLSEQYKSGRSNPLIAFLIASWSNIRAIFTREPSSVTYVLRKR